MDKVLRQIRDSLFMSLMLLMLLVAYVWIRLTEHWDPHELGIFATAGAALVFGGRWMVGKLLFGNIITNRRNGEQEADTSVTEFVDGDAWLEKMAATYKPGRRLYALPVGFDDSRKMVELSMRGSESHLMVIGMTGTGKSTFMNQMVISAAMSGRYQVIICGRSGKDYTIVREMKNVHLVTYGDGKSPSESRKAFAQALPEIIKSINVEAARRENYLEKQGVTSTYARSLRTEQRLTNVLFIIEEFPNAANLVKYLAGPGEQRALFAELLAVVQSCRAVGIKLCLVGQKASNQIPNDIRQQTTSIAFRVRDATESYHATGAKGVGAETLRVIDDEDNPATPSQFLMVGAKVGTKRLNMPLTRGSVLERAATLYEEDVKFLGYPDWVWGYEKPEDEEQTAAVRVKDDISQSRPAVIYQQRSKRLTAVTVREWAKILYATHPSFKDSTPAFTLQRTIAVFLCLFADLTVTDTVLAVFNGRNDRYFGFVRTCEGFLTQLEAAWKEREEKNGRSGNVYHQATKLAVGGVERLAV